MKAFKIIFFSLLMFLANTTIAQEEIPPEVKPGTSNTGKTLEEQAEEAAAREIGRAIGRRLSQDDNRRMRTEDRQALLERARAATRGDMIRRYNFEDSPYYNQMSGYVTIITEGKNKQGYRCLQYEVDLVYRIERYFFQPVMCQTASGEWAESSLEDVIITPRGEPSPVPGGWLPPVH